MSLDIPKIDRRKGPSRPKAARKGSTRYLKNQRKKPERVEQVNNDEIDDFLDNGWGE